MMVSEREMELSDEHNGIIELPGEPPVGIGEPLCAGDGRPADPMIDIKITPNRPTRWACAASPATSRPRARQAEAGGEGAGEGLRRSRSRLRPMTRAAEGCPVFAGRLIRGVKNGPRPEWLQHRLQAIGLRPISALVDITNYFTYDRNRPLHVYDADKLTGGIQRGSRARARPSSRSTARTMTPPPEIA